MDALDRVLNALDEEWRQATDDAKDAINDKMDGVKTKMKEAGVKIDTRTEELDRELDARLIALDEYRRNTGPRFLAFGNLVVFLRTPRT